MTFVFDEFFDSGMEESVSPFLTRKTRKMGKNLHLKSAFLAAIFLLFSFFLPPNLSALSLFFTFFLAGIPSLISSLEDLLSFEINIDILMTLAAFLSVLIGSGKEGGLLLVLFSVSGALEEAVRLKAKGSLLSLKKMSPTKALVLRADGSVNERAIKDVTIGMRILVQAGEMVPLDGRVLSGSCFINMAHVTGESQPEAKKEGDEVLQGGRVLDGSLTVEVIRTARDSTLQKIIELVTAAELAKPRLEKWFDKLSTRYATTIISLSLLFALAFPWFLSIPYLGEGGSIYRALTFLIAASPCALILAVPIAYLSAISSAASKGILLKGAVALDALASCKTMAFDKTGTITTGELLCTEIESSNEQLALQLAYSLERHSTHPIANALVKLGEKKGLSLLPLHGIHVAAGEGLEASWGQTPIRIGRSSFVGFQGDKTAKGVVTYLKVAEEIHIFHFKDEVRSGFFQVVKELEESDISVLMLTGDHFSSAAETAKEAGISVFFADLRPQEKLYQIDTLAKKGNLAMVGDGINDAPALTRATCGISMGQKGSKAAVDASDIVLLNDAVENVLWLVKKARKTQVIVKQNLVFAAGAIFVATVPALLGLIPLWLAVVLHEGGTLLVGLNALRLLKRKSHDRAREKASNGVRSQAI